MDLDDLLARCEAELRHRRGNDYKLEAAIGVAWCLSQMGRHSEALTRLNEFAPTRPSPRLMAAWLNANAYELTMLDRASEALVHLDDAAVVVDDQTPDGKSLAGCIAGTRGIALLHLARLQEAESWLLQALEIGAAAVAAEGRSDGPVAQQERILAAERYYWLSEIADRQGQPDEARRRLEMAAAAEGPYAARASARLGATK
jgi:tetratricopeptide (TPR) repeat protein